jgi:putative transposase
MRKQRRAIQLTKAERKALEAFVAHGKRSARAITRARLLFLLGAGRRARELAQILGVSHGTVYNVRKTYQRKAYAPILDLLQYEPRSGRPLKLDSRVEAQTTMLACRTPPTGRGRWTLQLIADKLVELAVTDSISYESVRRLLEKTNLSPG